MARLEGAEEDPEASLWTPDLVDWEKLEVVWLKLAGPFEQVELEPES